MKRIPDNVQLAIQELHRVFPDWTTRQIGDHVGVSNATVSRVIAGRTPYRGRVGEALKARARRELKDKQCQRKHELYLGQKRELDALMNKHKQQVADMEILSMREWKQLAKDFVRLPEE